MHIVFNYASGAVARMLGGTTCLIYAGDGSIEVMLPVDGGLQELRGAISSIGVGPAGEIHGQLGGAAFYGVVAFLLDLEHLDENCVTKPLEHFVTVGQFTLIG